MDKDRPIEIKLANQSAELSTNRSGTVPATQVRESTVSPIPSDPVTTVTSDPVPFNAMFADLFMVRKFGADWNDEEYKRMMLARWHYEQKHQHVNAKPFGGRFFDFGQAKPDASQIGQMTQSYKQWAINLAAMLPGHYSLSRVHLPLNQVGTHTLGRWVLNSFAIASIVDGCQQQIQRIEQRGVLRSDQKRFLENICTYRKQVADFTADYQYFGNTDYLDINYRSKLKKLLAMKGKYSIHGTVGYRGACQFLTRKDPYCEGMHEELRSGALQAHSYVMDDIYLMDKVVRITPEAKSQIEELTKKRRNVSQRLVFSVQDIERVGSIPLPAFSQALRKTNKALDGQRWLQDRNYLKQSGRTDFKRPPGYVFSLAISHVELYDFKTGEGLMRLPLITHGPKPDEALLKPLAMELETAPDTPVGPDIVGLQIGMTFDQADKIIRKHMHVGSVRIANRKSMPDMAMGEFDAFTSGRLYESADRKEWIVLFDDAPSAKNVVLAITRTVNWEAGKVLSGDLANSLVRKYGPIDHSRGGVLRWGETDRSCSPNVPDGMFQAGRWRNANGEKDDWSVNDFGNTGVPVPDNYQSFTMSNISKCKLGLMAHFYAHSSSKWDRLYQRLYDKKLYATHLLQSRDMLKNGTVSDEAVENSTASNVKL